MKKLFLILMALALVCSCQNPTPVQLEMEAYAKAHIANPDSYKFDYMGVEKEYKYVNDLYTYRQGLEEQAAKASGANKAAYEAEMMCAPFVGRFNNKIFGFEFGIVPDSFHLVFP